MARKAIKPQVCLLLLPSFLSNKEKKYPNQKIYFSFSLKKQKGYYE